MPGPNDANVAAARPATGPHSGLRAIEDIEAWVLAEVERRMAATPAMLHSIDEAGNLIAVSDAWLETLGYSREEALGQPSVAFLAPESRVRAVRDVLPEFFRSGRIDNARYQMVKKSGELIDVLMSGVLTEGANGGRVSLAVVTDITALLQTRRRLADSEARYRSLVEDQSESVCLVAPDGQVLYANRAYAGLNGLGPEEMIGRSLYEFVPEEQAAGLAERLRRACETRERTDNENQIVLPSGERRWFAWSNRALFDGDGRITAIHCVGRDIQDRFDTDRRLQESEARYRFLAEHSTDLILLVDGDGNRLYASPASRRLLGYEPEEMVALRLSDVIHTDDAPRVLPILAARPSDTLLTYRMRRKSGGYVWVETTGRTVELASGERQRLIIVRDIENRVAAEEHLKASETRYRLLADNSTDVVMALDRNLVRTYVSPASYEMFGYRPEELVGLQTGDNAHPDDKGRHQAALRALLDGRAEGLVNVVRRRHRDGRWVWTETCYRSVRDAPGGGVTGLVATVRDVGARKAVEDELAEANRRLQALAGQDALTGLANRRGFDEALATAHRRARRYDHGVALIMIDVDRFKAFNDLYGHPAGDAALRRIADAISGAIRRPDDIAARYGGEEFAVVLPATDEKGALAVAACVQQSVFDLAIEHRASERGRVTVSAGVAVARPGRSPATLEILLGEADRALYMAKGNGRNAIVLSAASQAAA